MQPGAAHFFDGMTAQRHDVHIVLGPSRMELVITGDSLPAALHWPLTDLRADRDGASDTRLVLMRHADRDDDIPRDDARLILLDPTQIAWVQKTRPHLFRRDVRRGTGKRVLTWAAGAIGAVALMLFVILPAMANTLAKVIPRDSEIAFGKTVSAQMERALGGGALGKMTCSSPKGDAALSAMVARLTNDQALSYDLTVRVLNHPMINAFAAPGGQVVILRGLLDKATSPDEVAAVLAHEIGHVEARDPTRAALRAAGSAGLLTMLIGDFTGGAALAIVGEHLLSASYTRQAEAEADEFALAMLDRANVDADGLAAFFDKLDAMGGRLEVPEYLSTHPDTTERAKRARSFSQGQSGGTPVLSDTDWAALQSICSSSANPAPQDDKG